jgi:hypothetical protein
MTPLVLSKELSTQYSRKTHQMHCHRHVFARKSHRQTQDHIHPLSVWQLSIANIMLAYVRNKTVDATSYGSALSNACKERFFHFVVSSQRRSMDKMLLRNAYFSSTTYRCVGNSISVSRTTTTTKSISAQNKKRNRTATSYFVVSIDEFACIRQLFSLQSKQKGEARRDERAREASDRGYLWRV